MTDRCGIDDSTENAESHDPTEKADAKDPIEPSEKADPIEPIDKIDPRDPIDRMESCDHSDQSEVLPGACASPGRRRTQSMPSFSRAGRPGRLTPETDGAVFLAPRPDAAA